MNPHACEFIPSSKPDSSELRKYEKQYLTDEITAKKNELTRQNQQLITLHNELNTDYSILAYQINRSKTNEYPCYTSDQIDTLHSKFTSQSQYYYKQYSKFNDVTAELITLQQKLHRLLLTPETEDTTANIITTANETTANEMQSELNSCVSEYPLSPPSQIQSMQSYNALPPIMECDGECIGNEWNESISINTNSSVISSIGSINKSETELKEEEEEELLEVIPIANAKEEEELEELEFNYIEYENKINLMLDLVWKSNINEICENFNKFIYLNCCNNKCIELLIDLIISYSINNKPVFFGNKYSILMASVVEYIIQIQSENINFKRLNIYNLIWKISYDSFRKLQFGNDSTKFIHICIIIAELFNKNLLKEKHIFNYIFKSILECENKLKNKEICENDIEGIYEIFKRCYKSLYNKNNKKILFKYLKILNNIKTWNKFQNGITRVPFMINQMQTTINNHKKHMNSKNNKNFNKNNYYYY